MDSWQTALAASVQLYRAIDSELQQLDERLAGLKSAEIVQALQRIDALYTQLRPLDLAVMDGLHTAPETVAGDELYRQRLALLGRLAEKNRMVLARVNGMISTLSVELGQIKTGRNALTGYKADQESRGRVVRAAC